MKLISILSLLLWLFPVAVFAQSAPPASVLAADSQASEVVPGNNWAYSALNWVQQAGIVASYHLGTYSGSSELTRYQFAVAVSRATSFLGPPISGPSAGLATYRQEQATLKDHLIAMPGALAALMQLVQAFQADLEQLGEDVPAIQARLAAWQTLADPEANDFVYPTDPAYPEVLSLEEYGYNGGRRALTRVELASLIAGLLPLTAPNEAQAQRHFLPFPPQPTWIPPIQPSLAETSAKFPAATHNYQDYLIGHPQALAALSQLVRRFRPELQLLGQNTDYAEQRLTALAQKISPFPDVPKNHWAYKAVRQLQIAGIVVGEPDADYQADR